MRLRNKILVGVAAFFGVAFAALAITVSYDSPCPPVAADASDAESMRAIMNRCYGVPEGVRLETIAKPTPPEGRVLIKVHAASVNPAEWYRISGQPSLIRLDERHWCARGRWSRGLRRRGHRGGRGRRTSHSSSRVMKCSAASTEPWPNTPSRASKAPLSCKPANMIVRGSRRHSDRRHHRAAGAARSRRHQGRAEGTHQRRLRRCGHLRRADREVIWRGSHRRVQHAKRRDGALTRRGPRHRLHAKRTSPKARSATTSSWTTSAITASSTWRTS